MVPISEPLVLVLKQINRKGFLFLIHGDLISVDYFANYIRTVSKKCGIEFRSYMLRHKFATDLQKTETPRTCFFPDVGRVCTKHRRRAAGGRPEPSFVNLWAYLWARYKKRA